MIYDCFTFDNEVDILEWRFKELGDTVDYFVITEMAVTHQGLPRDFVWPMTEPDTRWDKWRDKIRYVQISNVPISGGRGGAGTRDYQTREAYQRNQMSEGFRDAKEGDIIIVSDVDEIPEVDKLKEAIKLLDKYPLVGMELRTFVWSMKWRYPGEMLCTAVTKWQPDLKCQTVRVERGLPETKKIKNAGWHFTWFGGPDQNIRKLNSFSHAELLHKEGDIGWMIAQGYDINGQKLNEYEWNEPLPKALQ